MASKTTHEPVQKMRIISAREAKVELFNRFLVEEFGPATGVMLSSYQEVNGKWHYMWHDNASGEMGAYPTIAAAYKEAQAYLRAA